MKIDVICPLYNAEKYLMNLHETILMQENIELHSVNYILTRCKDRTEDILKELEVKYVVIEPSEFSHSSSREMIAKNCNGDIIVFISQDIKIMRKDWLFYLTKDIAEGKCEAAYSRQLAEKNNIEKYTREKNYGEKSLIKTKDDIKDLGLSTFFFSDASSAINRKVFEELNYYDGKRFASNEDQYIAYKLIMNGYKIKYCAESEVYHSHDFSFKTLYKRYQDTGDFYRAEPYMNNYGTNSAGAGMAKYILKKIIEDKNVGAALEYIPNMAARFLGMKIKK